MKFTILQSYVSGLIAASPLFSADGVVFVDAGQVKTAKERALDITSAPPGPGYNIAVWPPASGNSDGETSGSVGSDVRLVVRFEVNPALLAKLATMPPFDAGVWLNQRIEAIANAILADPPELNGQRFTLHEDAFELVNFDEGLVAYHIRFKRLAVFDTSTQDNPLPTVTLQDDKGGACSWTSTATPTNWSLYYSTDSGATFTLLKQINGMNGNTDGQAGAKEYIVGVDGDGSPVTQKSNIITQS